MREFGLSVALAACRTVVLLSAGFLLIDKGIPPLAQRTDFPFRRSFPIWDRVCFPRRDAKSSEAYRFALFVIGKFKLVENVAAIRKDKGDPASAGMLIALA